MSSSWERRFEAARTALLPWIEQTRALSGSRVLDLKCGTGAHTAAVAEKAASVLALDTDEAAVVEAAKRLGGDVEVGSGSFAEVAARGRERAGEIDVVLLISALEHLTVDERLRSLALAFDVLAPGGVLVVYESPNRLLPWDYHTSGLPFFGMLPDELAVLYAERSPRPEFAESVGGPAASATLARWGRAISFHELELALPGFPANVVAGGYEPALIETRPVHREELALARFLQRARPDLPAVFSRYWLDLIVAREADASMRRWFSPWSFETTNSRYVDLTEWDTLLLRGPHARLTATFGAVADELLIGIADAVAPLELRIRAGEEKPIVHRLGGPGAATPEYVHVRLDRGVDAVTLDASEACHVTFVGFAAHP